VSEVEERFSELLPKKIAKRCQIGPKTKNTAFQLLLYKFYMCRIGQETKHSFSAVVSILHTEHIQMKCK